MKLTHRKRLLALMVVHEVSQRRLAAAAGYNSHAYVGRLLRGEVDTLEPEAAERIAEFLGVDPDDLFAPRLSTLSGHSAHPRATVVGLVLAVVAVLLTAGGPSPAAGSEPRDDPSVTTYRTTSGLVVSTLRQGESTFTSYGAPIAEVSVAGTADSETATVTFGTAAPGRATVYEMSLQAGMSAAEACAFARGFDPAGCRTSAQLAGAQTTTRAARAAIYDSRCYRHTTTKGDGTKYLYTCDIRRILARSKRHNRAYLSNQMKGSAWYENPGTFADRVNGAGAMTAYENDTAHAVDYAPNGPRTVGSCHDVTTSATSRNGVTVSTTATVCQNKLSPWHSPAFQWFGSKWTGPSADEGEDRGFVSTSVYQLPYYFWHYQFRTWLRWT